MTDISNEVVIGKFRLRNCECGKCNGNPHFHISYDNERFGPFSDALPAIMLLIQFAHERKLENKFRAIGLGQLMLDRLPIVEGMGMPAAEAEMKVTEAFPDLQCIIAKIFADLKEAESNYAREDFGAFFSDRVDKDGDDLLRAASD
ncbi:MAG: hypothetical protein NTW66_03995 [Candidatus Magasanikbacteria bacterium]|nr:hypothetical protein [Candidatus Magasanikbacteria bacterium]